MLLAIGATFLIADPLIHPNMHPRLCKLGYQLIHYHPRLLKCLEWSFIFSMVFVYLLLPLAILKMNLWDIRKKGLLKPSNLKSNQYLERPLQLTIPELLATSWDKLKDGLPGLCIRVPDMRPAYWELIDINEHLHTMKLELRYVHDPLARKCSTLYPRKVLCTVQLKGKGVRTDVQLDYSANSPMDYKTAYAVIEKTTATVKEGSFH